MERQRFSVHSSLLPKIISVASVLAPVSFGIPHLRSPLYFLEPL